MGGGAAYRDLCRPCQPLRSAASEKDAVSPWAGLPGVLLLFPGEGSEILAVLITRSTRNTPRGRLQGHTCGVVGGKGVSSTRAFGGTVFLLHLLGDPWHSPAPAVGFLTGEVRLLQAPGQGRPEPALSAARRPQGVCMYRALINSRQGF